MWKPDGPFQLGGPVVSKLIFLGGSLSLAESFYRLFLGLARSHGWYVVPPGGQPTRGKLHNKSWARTVHAPLTPDLWESHLAGKAGLGVVPIRDDATCVFGAIDFDPHDETGAYAGIDHEALAKEILRLTLPLIVCRSKSGGAHAYLFLAEPAPAELVRAKLTEWSVLLGHPGSEIFPMQTRLASERDDGNWINMPYFAGVATTRYAVLATGEALTPEKFIDAANLSAITIDDLQSIKPPADEISGKDFLEAPPCLETLGRRGFGEWQNNSLVNIAVYLKKLHGEGWGDHLEHYNQKYMDPPVDRKEISTIIKSVSKKEYFYMCKKDPICAVCNKEVCKTRKYGIGGGSDDEDPGVSFGEIVKVQTDPPIYIWDIDGARIELSAEDLMNQIRFQKLVIEKLDKWPRPMKPAKWVAFVSEKLAKVSRVEVPEDATHEGQFWAHLQKFCTSRVRGKSMDELLMGKPYSNPADGRTYFCSNDLFQYLAQHRFSVPNEKDVFKWLRKKGVGHHFGVIKGKGMNYWSVPSFPEQTEPHDVPRSNVERM